MSDVIAALGVAEMLRRNTSTKIKNLNLNQTNPCQSITQTDGLTDLHLQQHRGRPNVRLSEAHTLKCCHNKQISGKLLTDEICDLLLSDDRCYF